MPNFLHFGFMQTEKQGLPYTQQGGVNAGILFIESFFLNALLSRVIIIPKFKVFDTL